MRDDVVSRLDPFLGTPVLAPLFTPKEVQRDYLVSLVRSRSRYNDVPTLAALPGLNIVIRSYPFYGVSYVGLVEPLDKIGGQAWSMRWILLPS